MEKMITKPLVDVYNVEALSPDEAKAAFLSLVKMQRPWTEITNDQATWPPTDEWVVVRFDNYKCPALRVIEGNYMTCVNGLYVTIRSESTATHWRPI